MVESRAGATTGFINASRRDTGISIPSDIHREQRGCFHAHYLPLQSGGFLLGGSAQLKLLPTRIEAGSTVFGFTGPVKSGKCCCICANGLIRLPVTTTRAPDTSASFAGPMTPV